MKGKHPNTPGFWLEYRDKVAALLPGQIIKKRELEQVMSYYINDHSPEDCATDLKAIRKQALL